MKQRLPNLFIFGFPKCGTTTLFKYLAAHPDIYMTKVKEPHYFSKDFWQESDKFHGRNRHFFYRSKHDYLKMFEDAKNQIILGEASTSYSYSKVAASEVKKFNRNAKVIIVIRDPAEFIKSWYNYLTYYGEEDSDSLLDVLELEEARLKDWGMLPKNLKHPTRLRYSFIADYLPKIKKIRQIFGDQLLVVVFEEFVNNKKKEYKNILRFLGVDVNFEPNFIKFNEHKTPRFLKVKRAVDSIIRPMLGRKMIHGKYEFLRSFYRFVFAQKGKNGGLSDNEKGRLKAKYYGDVKKMGEFLNKDLIKIWKYETEDSQK